MEAYKGSYSPHTPPTGDDMVNIPIDLAIATDNNNSPHLNGLVERKLSHSSGESHHQWKYSEDTGNDKVKRGENLVGEIWRDRDTRNLFLFVIVASCVAVVEILVGVFG